MSNVLYWDIETAPMRVDSWGLWNQTHGIGQIREDPRVLCLAWKWRGLKPVHFASEWQDGREAMLGAAYEILGQADVVADFNGTTFDVPWLMGEFARMGWGPPAPFQRLDLLKVIKRKFRFPSNKLQYVSGALGIGGKVQHEGHGLWVKVMEGDPRAQAKMERYNKQDVVLLEKLHDRLMPWITSGPNMALIDGVMTGCPNGCGDTLRKEGFRHTLQGTYQRYQCRTCTGWFTDTKRIDGVSLRGAAS